VNLALPRASGSRSSPAFLGCTPLRASTPRSFWRPGRVAPFTRAGPGTRPWALSSGGRFPGRETPKPGWMRMIRARAFCGPRPPATRVVFSAASTLIPERAQPPRMWNTHAPGEKPRGMTAWKGGAAAAPENARPITSLHDSCILASEAPAPARALRGSDRNRAPPRRPLADHTQVIVIEEVLIRSMFTPRSGQGVETRGPRCRARWASPSPHHRRAWATSGSYWKRAAAHRSTPDFPSSNRQHRVHVRARPQR